MMKKLPGNLLKQFLDALLSAFPEKSILAMMVRIQLNENLAEIAGGDSLSDTVYSLITWAEAAGCLGDLLSGSRAEQPGNSALQEFEAVYRQWQAEGSPAGISKPELTDIGARLRQYNLHDTQSPDFGTSVLTEDLMGLVRNADGSVGSEFPRATSFVAFLSIPQISIQRNNLIALRQAPEILDLDNWYGGGDRPPRHHSREIFPLRIPRSQMHISGQNVVLERNPTPSKLNTTIDRLLVDRSGDVAYASSILFFDEFADGRRIFRLGAIINFLWAFLCLTWELCEGIKQPNSTHICVAMIGTEGTSLGQFVYPWTSVDPYNRFPWGQLQTLPSGHTCKSLDILVSRDVDFAEFEWKIPPRVIQEIAEEIALEYGYTEAPCFTANGELIAYDLSNQ